MVDLSFLAEDPTLVALKAAVEKIRALEPRRDYIGASGIGGVCDRPQWYEYNKYPKKSMDWKGCFATEDGHRTEDMIIKRLLMVDGITITNRQDEYAYKTFFKGHPEGIISGLKQSSVPHLLEVKTCNDKKYNNLKKCIDDYGEKFAFQKWDQTYYAQGMVLCYGFNVTRHYLVVALPGGRDVISCRTNADNNFAKVLLDKAERIANTKEVPSRISDNQDFFICKFCSWKDLCWQNE